MKQSPRLLLTMGDVAGIGPEIIAKAWPELVRFCRPTVIGDPGWMLRGLRLVGDIAELRVVEQPEDVRHRDTVVSVLSGTDQDMSDVRCGELSAAAGRAAYDFLCTAIDRALTGQADGIVTAPFHKEGLHRAGLTYPGHTEILAERTGAREFAMMLFAKTERILHGLGVVHVTLHCALQDVFRQLSVAAVEQKIFLLHNVLANILERTPRIGVAGLNPHAGDGGLFGEEEEVYIRPAIETARAQGIDATGPWPADTLFVRALAGEFDGVTVMYHDQGHIAMKLLAGFRAVNITLGLPIVRTSVAHGTAYDIAGKGIADPTSLIEAAHVAALLCRKKMYRDATEKTASVRS